MFLTALAPNLLALELAGRTAKVAISWFDWALAFAPVGILLLLAVPLLAFKLPKWCGAPPAAPLPAPAPGRSAGRRQSGGALLPVEACMAQGNLARRLDAPASASE